MTDYRDPNYRDPNPPRDPGLPPDGQSWSNATWGWIAGMAVVVLVLIFAFGRGDQVATDTTAPPATTGQRTIPLTPPGGPNMDSPPMTRPAPVPAPAPVPETQPPANNQPANPDQP